MRERAGAKERAGLIRAKLSVRGKELERKKIMEGEMCVGAKQN